MEETIQKIRQLHKQRRAFHKAEKSLGNQIWAYNHFNHESAEFINEHLAETKAIPNLYRGVIEKEMVKEAQKLPIFPWVDSIKGVAALGLAQIIGEAGDLNNYPTISKLWKRMGLAVMDGCAQGRVVGNKRATGDVAIEHGYSPSRRSIMYNVSESIIKNNFDGKKGDPDRKDAFYRGIYLMRKKYEAEKATEKGLEVVPSEMVKKRNLKKGTYMTVGHINNRAKRYMQKRYLKDLWIKWHEVTNVEIPTFEFKKAA
jgi:hypothetical protein